MEDENDSDSSIEAAEVVRHGSDVEIRPFDESGCGGSAIAFVGVFGGDHLLEEPVDLVSLAAETRIIVIHTSPSAGPAY